MKMTRLNRLTFLMPMIALAIAGVFLIQYLTANNIGLVNDSVGYVAGARNILAGNGYSRLTGDQSAVPITSFPPMLSIVLAGLISGGADIFAMANAMNSLLFGLTIVLAGLLAYRASGSILFSVTTGVFILVSAPIFRLYTVLMSEPLFFLFSLLALLLTLRWAERQQLTWLVLAGFFTALTILTRYAGFGLFAAVALFILLFKRQNFTRKIISLGVYGLITALPVLAWLIRNARVTDNPINRQISYHPISAEKISAGLANLFGWLLPQRGGIAARLEPYYMQIFIGLMIILIVLVILMAVKKSASGDQEQSRTDARTLNLIYAVLYLAAISASMSFFDASSIYDHRLLAPFYVQLLILSAWLLSALWSKGILLRVASLGIIAVLLLTFLGDARYAVAELRADGQGYANSRWQESQMIAGAKSASAPTLYTNRTQALYLLANRPAYLLPSPMDPATGAPREGFDEEIAAIREQVKAGSALVIFFDYQELSAAPDERDWILAFSSGLPVYGEYTDGIIFGRK